MAGMFYSQKEAAEKLNMTEQQITELVEQGKLREFRDGANLLFKVNEVDSLTAETGPAEIPTEAGDEQELELIAEDAAAQPPEAEQELEPIAEDTAVEQPKAEEDSSLMAEDTAVEQPDDTSEEFDLLAAEDEPAAPPSADDTEEELMLSDKPDDELTSADTAITREGINVLDGTETGYDLTEDTMSETKAMEAAGTLEEIEDDVNLDTFGSGSGLLDLSLQADDTSLGGILDEIYTPQQEQDAASADESASAEDVAAEANMIADEGLVTQQPAAFVQGYIEPEADSASNLFGMMLFLPLLVVIYTAIVASAGLFNIMPAILEQTRSFMLLVLGGLLVVALIVAVMGAMAGKPATGSKPKVKKQKLPKAGKEKPKKEKKAGKK